MRDAKTFESPEARLFSARVRIMYAYPGHVTRRLADTMARLPNVAHYIDIPLQHASETMLRRMRRPSGLPSLRIKKKI